MLMLLPENKKSQTTLERVFDEIKTRSNNNRQIRLVFLLNLMGCFLARVKSHNPANKQTPGV